LSILAGLAVAAFIFVGGLLLQYIDQAPMDANISEKFFDPIEEKEGYWTYKLGPGNGLRRDVRLPQTNGFRVSYGDNNSVQRLWADPQHEYSGISAWQDKDERGLLVSFFRRGYGCDVTIRPHNDEAVNIKPDGYTTLRIELQPIDEDIAFCLRIVDGRGTHWAWADKRPNSGSTQSVLSFKGKDSREREMHLGQANGETCTFYFDLSSRKKWEVFDSDGGVAPPKPSDTPFDVIQFIVIEPGIFQKREKRAEAETKTPGHFRPLADSREFPSGDEPPKSKFLIKRIDFVK